MSIHLLIHHTSKVLNIFFVTAHQTYCRSDQYNDSYWYIWDGNIVADIYKAGRHHVNPVHYLMKSNFSFVITILQIRSYNLLYTQRAYTCTENILKTIFKMLSWECFVY